ncbi:sporulation histidine kinase inhibitor Sda [Bacillus sp. MRMR6]
MNSLKTENLLELLIKSIELNLCKDFINLMYSELNYRRIDD